MVKSWQEEWVETIGWQAENAESQEKWNQRKEWHVEEQTLHDGANPYEEHANSYDAELSQKSWVGDRPEICEDVEKYGTPPSTRPNKSYSSQDA